MKAALVRGPSLNPWELQSFDALPPRWDLTLFATTHTPYWRPTDRTRFPIERCYWPDQHLAPLGRTATWLFNGLSSRLLGLSYHMAGLEDRLARFDLFHGLETHNTLSFQCAQAKRRDPRKRLVLTVWETIPFRGESHPIRRRRKKEVIQLTDRFLAVSDRTRRMLHAEGVDDSRIDVIPMGIDCEHFRPGPRDEALRKAWGASAETLVVLCVARVVPEKGVDDLVEAAAHVRRTVQRPVKVVWAGTGPERERIEKRAASLGLRDVFQFVGGYGYSQMPSVYSSADLFVLASRPTPIWEEQFGFALVEAMAAGLPVVSTRSGAIPEVVGDAGRLVAPQSPDELAQTLTDLLKDETLRKALSQAGRSRALERFQGRLAAEKFAASYDKCFSV